MSPVDSTATVVTPERIAFDYSLAGPFRRAPAYALDLIVRAVLLVAMFLGLVLTSSTFSLGNWDAYALAALMIVNFGLSFFYGVFCESVFNGRTIGKAICGLRVIGIDGRPIQGSSAMIRNLLRPADMLPIAPIVFFNGSQTSVFDIVPTGMVALLVMAMTPRLQRLGDLAAGTMVVVDEKVVRLSTAEIEDPRVAALSTFIPPDYRITRTMTKMLSTYVDRRKYLSPPRRREIAALIGNPLIRRFAFRNDIDPDLLLMALHHHATGDHDQDWSEENPRGTPAATSEDVNHHTPLESPMATVQS